MGSKIMAGLWYSSSVFVIFFGKFMTIAPFMPMTKEDVASVLGVSIRTIENLVRAGQMPAPGRVGGRVLWHPEVFYSWLDKVLRIPSPLADESKRPAESMEALESPRAERPESQPKLSSRRSKSPMGSAVQRMQARQARKLRLDALGEAG